MEKYFEYKLFMEKASWIGLIILLVIYILLRLSLSIIPAIRYKRIEKFFLSKGYKRKYDDRWVREVNGEVAFDRDIKRLSLREIKKKYK